MISGVIFDMDGVMTDTERLFLEGWEKVLRRRGLPVDREVVVHCIGLNHADTAAYVRGKYGSEFDYEGILAEIADLSNAYCQAHGVPVKPGLYALLDVLDGENLPYAVATSTSRDRAEARLKRIQVYDRLTGLVTGDQVTKGKPDPEIFTKAAELLGLPAAHCLVLEDSPHGLLAASRAGCQGLMVPDLKPPDGETKQLADVVSSLWDVPNYLRAHR